MREGVLAACTRGALPASPDSVGETERGGSLPAPFLITGARVGTGSEISSDSSLKRGGR